MTHSLASTAVKLNSPSVWATPSQPSESKLHSLSALWARKYYLSVTPRENEQQLKKVESITEIGSQQGRINTASKLSNNITLASAQAWSLTETLLSEEIRRHGINPDLINPLEIAADTRNLFLKVLNAYTKEVEPARLSVIAGGDCGKVRQKYTSADPRAIGFVSMQFHYTGQKLLECLSPTEQTLFQPYLKVMDDHMYMPLQAAYKAAADHAEDSTALLAVQHLLPATTKVAHAVYERVCRQHPGYQSYSGTLKEETVKISSIRDVEMFQVYLCLCVLEGNICSVQQQLFPLCVMLYPRLQVSWKLVQDMLQAIVWEMHDRLPLESVAVFLPYLRTFSEMFSGEVFQNN
ncbi:hypothetical protein [Argonema galeatum]|uniref:hypothetical protein n=1 Tax=Argonema galeatum TaxID=2942762 RepID=UPI002012879E|nr:hypothetical protein [Argonema galeatum]MCL1464395.1 hypothetical protein [Argonema galeatum A003/A1]